MYIVIFQKFEIVYRFTHSTIFQISRPLCIQGTLAIIITLAKMEAFVGLHWMATLHNVIAKGDEISFCFILVFEDNCFFLTITLLTILQQS